MSREDDEFIELEQLAQLKPIHFADLIRACQLIFDPARGVSGITRNIDWNDFGIPDDIADNLKALGKEFRYALPSVPPEIVWTKLTEKTRIWFVENKEELWKFEEYFPALDED